MNPTDNSLKSAHPPEVEGYGPFLPTLLGLLSLALWFGFQTSQLLMERDNLRNLSDNQSSIYANAEKMRGQMELIAAGTARLAQAGNPNAQQIIDSLQARGIAVNRNPAANK